MYMYVHMKYQDQSRPAEMNRLAQEELTIMLVDLHVPVGLN